MLNGGGNENGQKIRWSHKQKQKTTLHVTAYFFVHFFAVVVATWNFQVTSSREEMSLCRQKICCLCSCSLFSFHCRSFSPWRTLAFSFSHRRYKIVMLFFQRNSSPFWFFFFISRSSSLSLFFSLSVASLSPTFSFSLSFAFSIFQICGHDN